MSTGDGTFEALDTADGVGGTMLSTGRTLGVMAFAALTMAGSLEGPQPLEALSGSGTMVSGAVGTGTARFELVTGDGLALTGGTSVGVLRLEPLQLNASTGTRGATAFEPLGIQATAVTGGVSQTASQLRALAGDGAALSNGLSSGAAAFQPLRLDATAQQLTLITGDGALASLQASGTMISGHLARGDMQFEPLRATGTTGFPHITATGGGSFEPLQIASVAGGGLAQQTVAPSTVTYTGIVLNTRTRAVSTYVDLAPNSIANFNGVTLMATANGIVSLDADTDLGEHISASITSGKTDIGAAEVKRVLTAYVGYRSSGDLELTLVADDHHEGRYILPPLKPAGDQHQSRVKLAKGIKGTYWQWTLENKDGVDFALDRIELHPAKTGQGV